MNTPELIRRKREGQEIAPEEIREFIEGYVADRVPAYQVSAFLMAVFFRGMTPAEAAALTRAMLESGDRFDLSGIDGPKTDKHSTGGVGDKVSLVLAPLVAEAGGIVPMVSGRGLGHSGGTLDKLDAIPGYRWGLEEGEFRRVLGTVGCAIIGQTDRFVPADKRLYALRDVTATVESIPLICGSILSKKAAAGTQYLVMDVKCGNGAFMETHARARALAQGLIDIGTALGMHVSALITRMSQPLGVAVGNAIEVRECLDVLRGSGPEDTREVTLRLSAEMLRLAGIERDGESAYARLVKILDSGKALERFARWIEAQGGNPRIVDNPDLLEVARETGTVPSPESGYIQSVGTRELGVAANLLGAGRIAVTDTVDTAVGMLVHARPGDRVRKGDPLVTLLHRSGRNLEQARRMVLEAYRLGEEAVEPLPLIIDSLDRTAS